MIKNPEEATMLLIGENMAIGLVLKAMIESHPDPAALRVALGRLQARANAALKAVPPPDLQRFRYEQVLDELTSHIKG